MKESSRILLRNTISKSQNFGNPECWQRSKRRAPNNPADLIRLIRSWKYWIWDQYLPENLKWAFGKSLKFETKKPRNFETNKTLKCWTKKPRNQDPPYPSTYRLPPLHPTTLLWGREPLLDAMNHRLKIWYANWTNNANDQHPNSSN